MGKTPMTWTYYEGDWHAGDLRILGANSHATWLGSLVFDGARMFEGVAPDLDRHCARINTSARALDLAPTMTGPEIEALCHEGLKKFPAGTDIYIRPMYWAEEGDVGILPPKPSSTAFALCLVERPMVAPSGFTITTTRYRRPTLADMPVNAKAACLYPNNARMLREAAAKGFGNALVADAIGNVAETASANVFMARDGDLFTPVANGTFLAGITRARHMKLLREAGKTVHETVLTFDDFHNADEVFLSGNMNKVTPVTAFDDTHYQHGPITKLAHDLYWDWAHSRR